MHGDTLKFIFLTFIISILSSSIVGLILQNYSERRIVSVDLGKIFLAQTMMTNKILASGNDIKPWMKKINRSSTEFQAIISEVAGPNALVVVSPAILQGARNITNQVLTKMDLPLNVPDSISTQGVYMPLYTVSKDTTENVLEWLLP